MIPIFRTAREHQKSDSMSEKGSDTGCRKNGEQFAYPAHSSGSSLAQYVRNSAYDEVGQHVKNKYVWKSSKRNGR